MALSITASRNAIPPMPSMFTPVGYPMMPRGQPPGAPLAVPAPSAPPPRPSAGLLSGAGTAPAPPQGLLGGLSPLLMGAGLGLLSQGPSLTPQGPLAGLGPGLGLGLQMMQLQRQQALDYAKLQQEQDKAQATLDAERREREAAAADRAAMRKGLIDQGHTGAEADAIIASGAAEAHMGPSGSMERKMAKDRHGVLRYLDTGKAVFDPADVGPAPLEQPKMSDVGSLRGQYIQETRDNRRAVTAYQGLKNLTTSDNPTHATDIATVFAFMKVNDPGSTVQQGEQATVRNAGNVPERVRAWYNSVLGGASLTGDQRRNILAAATDMIKPRISELDSTNAVYRGIAERRNIVPEDILTWSQPEGLFDLPDPAPSPALSTPTPAMPAHTGSAAERLAGRARSAVTGFLTPPPPPGATLD